MLFKIRFVKSKKVQNTPILLYRYFLEFPEKKQFIYNIEFLQSVDKVPANAGTLSVLITVFLIE